MNGKESVLFIGAHFDEIEFETPVMATKLASRGLRVVILNPVFNGDSPVIRRLGPGAKERFAKESMASAKKLGCEKILWDYCRLEASKDKEEITRKIAQLLADVNPSFVFIHWPYDSHADHRVIAKASFQAIQDAAPLARDPFHKFRVEEIFAFQTMNYQAYRFWPDFFVSSNANDLRKAKSAFTSYRAFGEKVVQTYWENYLRKTNYWGTVAGGRHVEAFKYIGKEFPVHGLKLARVLGKDLISVTSDRWLFGEDYS